VKVLILAPFPLDWEKPRGGIESTLLYFLDGISEQRDVELQVVTSLPSVSTRQVRQRGPVRITYLPRIPRGRLVFYREDFATIRRIVEDERPDIVHAHGTTFYGGAAVASGTTAVITAHGIVFRELRYFRGWPEKIRGLWDALYERRCLGRARYLVAIAPYVQREFARVTQARVWFVPNPVSQRFFELPRDPDPNTILFAGVVTPRKAVHELVKAVSLVRKTMPQVHLRVAGDTASNPRYWDYVRRLVAEEGLEENVQFLGALPEAGVLQEYRRAAVLALPAHQETLPTVVTQAMAACLPVVSTAVGGVPDIVEDGRTGLLVRPGAVEETASALLRVLTDQALASSLASAAHEYALAHFRASVVAGEVLKVYQQVLEAEGTRTDQTRSPIARRVGEDA
jgi:glycosyltransferase involved in cell wall biosynthesis